MKNKRDGQQDIKPTKLLLQKQQVSRVQFGAVTGAGEISGLISGAPSAIGLGELALNTYNSNHWSDRLRGSPHEALWKRDHQNSGTLASSACGRRC